MVLSLFAFNELITNDDNELNHTYNRNNSKFENFAYMNLV